MHVRACSLFFFVVPLAGLAQATRSSCPTDDQLHLQISSHCPGRSLSRSCGSEWWHLHRNRLVTVDAVLKGQAVGTIVISRDRRANR